MNFQSHNYVTPEVSNSSIPNESGTGAKILILTFGMSITQLSLGCLIVEQLTELNTSTYFSIKDVPYCIFVYSNLQGEIEQMVYNQGKGT